MTPIKVGPYTLSNRVFMAPLTRMRAPDGVPTDIMATYYAQRSCAGLIISEASPVCPMGVGYPNVPGIFNTQHIQGWKKITAAVHQKNGRIFLQLWHVGRISHPDFHEGELPVAPSALTPKGEAVTPTGMKPFVTPRALETEEIPGIVKTYGQAAQNAVSAGFDGVEIHGANGYLLDQFFRDGTNRREDAYGGSVEKRARLMLDVIHEVIQAVGSERVGLRLSPSGAFNDMRDSDPTGHFQYLLAQLSPLNLAYLHIVDALEGDIRHGAKSVGLDVLREAYSGTMVVCGGYDKEKGERTLSKGLADAVAYGQLFIANPDLPDRFQIDAPLNEPDPSTFYGGGEAGYTDYPALRED